MGESKYVCVYMCVYVCVCVCVQFNSVLWPLSVFISHCLFVFLSIEPHLCLFASSSLS